MEYIKNTWGKVREAVDQFLAYDSNPPVVVERDNFKVIVSDALPPEANAMALAMYSRDPKSFLTHLDVVLKKGWKQFLSVFYVGYGHKSIGDCGSTTICAENVSMLTAKAIQDNQLYNGQEASTRYLDMAKQQVLNPLGTKAGKKLQERSMAFYVHLLSRLVPYLLEKFPMLPNDDPKVYKKAINAKAFDIARGFLPAGCTTYVGWHSNLRQVWDHLHEMAFHPLDEVRQVTEVMLEAVQMKYSSSFNFKSYPDQQAYMAEAGEFNYLQLPRPTGFWYESKIDVAEINSSAKLMRLLETRPIKTELPPYFARFGQMRCQFALDFGSFRDLQRHRSCIQVMPLLTPVYGFHPWYLDSLPDDLRKEAEKALEELRFSLNQISDPYIRQYYIPMGFEVVCEVIGELPSLVYIAELRSTQAVHPTLRLVAQDMGRALKEVLPSIALHTDDSADEWSTIRGKHDIVRKDEK